MKLCQITRNYPRRLLIAAAGSVAMLGSSAALSGNAMQTDSFDVADDLYVECLGEVIAYEEHIEIKYHVFETAAGNFHIVEKWMFYLSATGKTTGRTWYGILAGPSQINAGPVEVGQYAIRGVIRGIGKDTPGFAWTGSYKSTVNANGELVVENDTGGFSARCLGKQ